MLTLLFAFALYGRANSVPHIHCDPPWRAQVAVAPAGVGPLRPLAVYCHPNRIAPYSPLQSPDGRWTAIMSVRSFNIFDQAGGRRSISDVELSDSSMNFAGFRGPPPAAWSADSRFVWAVRQRVADQPGRRALTPLRPARVYPDGHVEDLRELRHPAGGLDGLLWVGGRGLALAQFGTRGYFYRPERADPDPTLAMVDAASGRVLESLPLSRLWPLTGITERGPNVYGLLEVLPALLPDGRIRVLIITQRSWIIWTQGEAPRRLANTPIAAVAPPTAFDGRRALVMRPYEPGRGDQEVVITACRIPGCRPPRDPRDRVWASLYDIDRGEVVWRLRRTADANDLPPAPPTISPNGRHALIGLEPGAGGERQSALVSMRNGRVLQTIPASYYAHMLGFADGGRLVWLNAEYWSAVYRLR